MSRKLMLAAGLATGYVLGSKAGRRRYQQLVDAGKDITSQQSLRDAYSAARDHAIRIVRDVPTVAVATEPVTPVRATTTAAS